jgi:pyruvate dehydrogenase E1 component
MAAGTAYAVHGIPTIPFYIFYSMFGFQRVGDMIWACADMMCRGFLLGGTAGRTTLNGEGLQHQDGHSLVLATTVPNLKSYDPAFAFELAVIVRDGIYRMYELGEKIFYYLTLYNENYAMPAMPEADVTTGIIRGAYCWQRSEGDGEPVHLLASGSLMSQAIAAAQLLEAKGFAPHIWSVTSYTELAREAEACERHNRLQPLEEVKVPYVHELFASESGPIIAVTDYMKSLPNSIARWMPEAFTVLGTDGFGLSEARSDIRDHFEVSHKYICQAALVGLHKLGKLSAAQLKKHCRSLGIEPGKPDPTER